MIHHGPAYQIPSRYADLFGRERFFDERSLAYPARRQLVSVPPPGVRRRHYQRPPHNRQQVGGTCVGHALRWKFDCGPRMLGVGRGRQFQSIGPDEYAIYREAKKHDAWDGEAYEGTSVTGAAKACQKVLHLTLPHTTTPVPLLGEYAWAWDAQTVIDFLLSGLGTIVIGVDWYEGMMDIDKEGFIHPTGRIVGGHSVTLDGIDLGVVGTGMDPDIFNTTSWGDDHGFRGSRVGGTGAGGRSKIKASALDPLLSMERWGEAMTSVEAPQRAVRMEA